MPKTVCRCRKYVCCDDVDMQTIERTGHHPHCSEAKLRLKISPELGDGVAHTIITDPSDMTGLIEDFIIEQAIGTKATIELVLMTDAEVEALESV